MSIVSPSISIPSPHINNSNTKRSMEQEIFQSPHHRDRDNDGEFNSRQHWRNQVPAYHDNALANDMRQLQRHAAMKRNRNDWEDEVEEDAQSKALRLFRFKILHLACNMDPTKESYLDRDDPDYRPTPDYDMVHTCRLVCKDWNAEISTVFRVAGKPVLVINPLTYLQKKRRHIDAESIMDAIKIPLVREGCLDAQHSDLPFPPIRLYLPSSFFYKEVESEFLYAWRHFERFLYDIQFDLPSDSTMSFYWPELTVRNLKKIKIKCTYDSQTTSLMGMFGFSGNPMRGGKYLSFVQYILNAARNVESFTLHALAPNFAPDLFRMIFPVGIKHLDVPLIKMTPEEIPEFLEGRFDPYNGKRNIEHVVVRAPIQAYKQDDGVTGCYASFLARKYAKSVKQMELVIAGQDMDYFVWSMRRDFVFEPLLVSFAEPLKELQSLTIHAGTWQICRMQSHSVTLPKLKNLTLTMLTRASQVEELLRSRSETVETLQFSATSEMPPDLMQKFSASFPNLKELHVCIKQADGWMKSCFHGFLRLTKLHVIYNGCTNNFGQDSLHSAITGIPMEECRAIINQELTVHEAMRKYEDCRSLRNLRDLEEFKLSVNSGYQKTDISVMFLSTFFHMPKLKRLILSKNSLMVHDDQKDSIRKENRNRVAISWV